jgi:hypothetical protein
MRSESIVRANNSQPRVQRFADEIRLGSTIREFGSGVQCQAAKNGCVCSPLLRTQDLLLCFGQVRPRIPLAKSLTAATSFQSGPVTRSSSVLIRVIRGFRMRFVPRQEANACTTNPFCLQVLTTSITGLRSVMLPFKTRHRPQFRCMRLLAQLLENWSRATATDSALRRQFTSQTYRTAEQISTPPLRVGPRNGDFEVPRLRLEHQSSGNELVVQLCLAEKNEKTSAVVQLNSTSFVACESSRRRPLHVTAALRNSNLTTSIPISRFTPAARQNAKTPSRGALGTQC